MSDETHQTKTEDVRDFAQLLCDFAQEFDANRHAPAGYGPSDVRQMLDKAAQKLADAYDYQENLERRQLADNMHIAKLEKALNAALDQGIALTDKVSQLMAPLAAANDRANNAEQAARNWEEDAQELKTKADAFACLIATKDEQIGRLVHALTEAAKWLDMNTDVDRLATETLSSVEATSPMAGATELISAQGVRYMHHPYAVPAPSPMLGFVP